MTNLTLAGWKRSVAAGVVESVPLQDFESAFLLAENFLGTQGGWVPDDVGDPTGPGMPASGISTSDAIIVILIEQQNRIYQDDITGVLNFRVVLNENLASGLSDDDVNTNLTAKLDDFVQAQLEKTSIEFVDIPSFVGTVTNGPTTQSERQAIQTSIAGGGRLINPKEIALVAARARFNLDNTFNVEYLYTEQTKDFFVHVVKYTSTTYQTLDGSATNRYGIKLDTTSFRITSGVVLSN